MKMAKPSEKDIDAAGKLAQILNTLDEANRWNCAALPDVPEFFQIIDEEDFDPEKRLHLESLYNAIVTLMHEQPSFQNRVIGGMCYVIMYDKNEIIDPDSDCIDLHPRFSEMWDDLQRETQAARYWNKRYHEIAADSQHSEQIATPIEERMKEAGMLSVAGILKGAPMDAFTRHAGVKDLDTLLQWAEMRRGECLRSQAEYDLGKAPDDMYEWTVAHAAVFGELHVNLRAAIAEQKQAPVESSLCLRTITDAQVNAVARSFWRRIEPYKNNYGKELPEKLPTEFMAHMATALTWVDKPVPADKPAAMVPDKEKYLGHASLAEMVSTHINGWRDLLESECARNNRERPYIDHELKALADIERAVNLDLSAPTDSQQGAEIKDFRIGLGTYKSLTFDRLIEVINKHNAIYEGLLLITPTEIVNRIAREANADRCPNHENDQEAS